MDRPHFYIWIAIFISSFVGIAVFAKVKTDVIQERKKAMAEREKFRKELKGNVGAVENYIP